jgi:hypothetical protein
MGFDLRPRCRALALAGVLLTLAAPSAARGAARSLPPPRFPTPASALPQGTTSKSSSAATPAATTPGASAPAGTPRRSGSPTTTYSPSTAGAGATPGAATVPGATSTPGATPIPGTTTTPAGALPGARPAPVRRAGAGSTSLSTGAILAAALAALLILACAVWAAVRWYAYEPHWTLTARHSFSEAGLRVSATWGEFADWVRLGR